MIKVTKLVAKVHNYKEMSGTICWTARKPAPPSTFELPEVKIRACIPEMFYMYTFLIPHSVFLDNIYQPNNIQKKMARV